MSDSFCSMPFVSTMLNTDTTYRFCCIARGKSSILRGEDDEYLKIGTDTIKDAWNSKTMRDVRKKMIEGETVPACDNCYLQEEVGKKSYRKMKTDEWTQRLGKNLDERVQYAKDHNYEIEQPPADLDLRLGNLCNLKCRMCNPMNSSQIAKEHFEVNQSKQFYRAYKDEFGDSPDKESILNLSSHFEGNFMWNDIISTIPHLQKVYMTGGEPTLLKNNYRFMDECVASGHAKDMELFFNINCTNVTDRFIEATKHFKTVRINASIDGFEGVNNYIRHPSKWFTIHVNFCRLIAEDHIIVNVTPVVQIYNVYNLIYLLDYIKFTADEDIGNKKDVGVDFLFNTHPKFLDVNILPDEIRESALERLYWFAEQKKEWIEKNWLTQNSMNGVIGLLKKDRNPDYEKHMNNFYRYTDSLDMHRKEKFEAMVPELPNDLAKYHPRPSTRTEITLDD